MANDKLYSETDIEGIANSIRGKNGTTNKYKVSQMAAAIDNLPTGGGAVESVDGQTGVVVTNAVKTIPQTLTESQKTQAQTNIGVKDVVENITWDTNKNAQFPANISLKNIIGSESAYFKNLYATPDGGTTSGVDIYGANGNIVSKGTVTANKFVGDGSGLTNLSSSILVVKFYFDQEAEMPALKCDTPYSTIYYAFVNNNQGVLAIFSETHKEYIITSCTTSEITFSQLEYSETSAGKSITSASFILTSEDVLTLTTSNTPIGQTIREYSVTVNVSDWQYNSGAPYPWSVTKSVTGLPATYTQTPVIEPDASTLQLSVQEIKLKEFSKIYSAIAYENQLMLYAYEKPSTSLTVKVRVVS